MPVEAALAEGLAVVRGDHHERVPGEVEVVEAPQQRAHLRVHPGQARVVAVAQGGQLVVGVGAPQLLGQLAQRRHLHVRVLVEARAPRVRRLVVVHREGLQEQEEGHVSAVGHPVQRRGPVLGAHELQRRLGLPGAPGEHARPGPGRSRRRGRRPPWRPGCPSPRPPGARPAAACARGAPRAPCSGRRAARGTGPTACWRGTAACTAPSTGRRRRPARAPPGRPGAAWCRAGSRTGRSGPGAACRWRSAPGWDDGRRAPPAPRARSPPGPRPTRRLPRSHRRPRRRARPTRPTSAAARRHPRRSPSAPRPGAPTGAVPSGAAPGPGPR